MHKKFFLPVRIVRARGAFYLRMLMDASSVRRAASQPDMPQYFSHFISGWIWSFFASPVAVSLLSRDSDSAMIDEI
jgi:hypothetical protein